MKVTRLQIVGRGLRNRCPNCGGATLFRRGAWFEVNKACPACGLQIERDEGFFIGSMSLNYGVTLVCFLTPVLLLAYKGVIGTTAAIVLSRGRLHRVPDRLLPVLAELVAHAVLPLLPLPPPRQQGQRTGRGRGRERVSGERIPLDLARDTAAFRSTFRCSETLTERWQSGRMRLTRNQVCRKVPGVRIPPSPPLCHFGSPP